MKLQLTLLMLIFTFPPLTYARDSYDTIPDDEYNFEPDPVKMSLGDKIIDTILSSNTLIKQGISQLTYQRCHRYLTFPGKLLDKFYLYGRGHVYLNPTWACNKAAIDTIKALDFYQEKVIEGDQFYFLRIVFKQSLLKLIQEQKTTLILKNIVAQMRTEYFSLYDSVYEVTGNNEKTLEFIAVMLQDFSPEKLHFHYLQLEKKRNKIPSSKSLDENLVLLDKVLSRLPYISSGEMVLSDDGTVVEKIVEMYPAKSLLNKEEISSLAYHYWVPAYVSFKLSRTFGNSDIHSYLSAFSFNYFYEVLFKEDLKLMKWTTIKQMLSIEDIPAENIVQAYDIYLGHEGPFFALGYSSSKWTPQKFVDQIMTKPAPAYNGVLQHIR